MLVPALTEPELREVVEGPAAAAGVAVDPDLTDAVVRDVHGQAAAALPLLSSALAGAWEHRDGDELTLAAYVRAGGVTGALAATAEAALASLGPDGPDRARRLLVRLAAPSEPGGGPSVTRRRVPLAELGLDGAGGSGRRAVVEALVGRRLLTVDAGHLEVTHEALLTEWPRLAGWLAEDALGRAVRTHLGPEATGWQAAGRPADRLYRGARLDAALEWLTRPDADPTAVERDFLKASADLAEAELAGARAQVRRERAARRRTRRLAAGLAFLVVVAVTGGLLAAAGSAPRTRARCVRTPTASPRRRPMPARRTCRCCWRRRRTGPSERHRPSRRCWPPSSRTAGSLASTGRPVSCGGWRSARTAAPCMAHTDTQVVAWDVATTGPACWSTSMRDRPVHRRTSRRRRPRPARRRRDWSRPWTPPGRHGRSPSLLRLFRPDGQVRWTRERPISAAGRRSPGSPATVGGWPSSLSPALAARARSGRLSSSTPDRPGHPNSVP